MNPIFLHDKAEIETFLRQDTFLNIYRLGDLDDFFWPYTTWHALKEGEAVQAIALFYTGIHPPTLLAMAGKEAPLPELLWGIRRLLPPEFYAHLSPGMERELSERYRFESHGEHYKMGLKDTSRLAEYDASAVATLTGEDLSAIEALYQASYPGNWFDSRMLETGQYFGLWEDERLVSVGGVHVYSPRYKVAALGNITTLPNHRGQGLATIVTARLCQSLLETVEAIGLNVRTDNASAIACYEKLGFEVVGRYYEWMVELRK